MSGTRNEWARFTFVSLVSLSWLAFALALFYPGEFSYGVRDEVFGRLFGWFPVIVITSIGMTGRVWCRQPKYPVIATFSRIGLIYSACALFVDLVMNYAIGAVILDSGLSPWPALLVFGAIGVAPLSVVMGLVSCGKKSE